MHIRKMTGGSTNVSSILGLQSGGNTTTVPLGAGATFTGSSIDIKDYAAINVAAYSDVDSAVNGLKMQFSPDGTNWDHEHTFSVTGNVGVSYAQAVELRYFRVVYVNGASAQTFFRLTTVLKTTTVTPSRYTVGQAVQSGMMADLSKSVIWGLSSSGGATYHTVKVTPSGSLTTDTTLSDITAVVGQELMAASLPVAIASDQSSIPVTDNGGSLTVDGTVAATQSGTWNINNISGTISLPTGAATETTLSALNTKVPSQGQAAMAGSLPVVLPTDQSAIPVTDNGSSLTVDGTVAATQSGTWNINNISGTISLPTGAATETTLSTFSAKIPALGQTTMSGSLPVTLASNQSDVKTVAQGKTVVDTSSIDYSSSNVTTSAYSQLVSSLLAAVTEIEIFDSSGEVLEIATGGAGSEQRLIYVTPGGNGRVPVKIAASTRVSIKAVTATASTGLIAINFYGA